MRSNKLTRWGLNRVYLGVCTGQNHPLALVSHQAARTRAGVRLTWIRELPAELRDLWWNLVEEIVEADDMAVHQSAQLVAQHKGLKHKAKWKAVAVCEEKPYFDRRTLAWRGTGRKKTTRRPWHAGSRLEVFTQRAMARTLPTVARESRTTREQPDVHQGGKNKGPATDDRPRRLATTPTRKVQRGCIGLITSTP